VIMPCAEHLESAAAVARGALSATIAQWRAGTEA
jgi:hypothetical protein